jgi:hypothetical protein
LLVDVRYGLHNGTADLTVASQQIRTSYRAPGIRLSSRIHVSIPLGVLVVGNEALSRVLVVEWSGDRGIR